MLDLAKGTQATVISMEYVIMTFKKVQPVGKQISVCSSHLITYSLSMPHILAHIVNLINIIYLCDPSIQVL